MFSILALISLLQDKHKSERRTEKLRDGREKRDSKDARSYRDDNGHKHDYKKVNLSVP